MRTLSVSFLLGIFFGCLPLLCFGAYMPPEKSAQLLEKFYHPKAAHTLWLTSHMSLSNFTTKAERVLEPDLELRGFKSFYQHTEQTITFSDQESGKTLLFPKTYRTIIDFQEDKLVGFQFRLTPPAMPLKAGQDAELAKKEWIDKLNTLGWTQIEENPKKICWENGAQKFILSIYPDPRLEQDPAQKKDDFVYLGLEFIDNEALPKNTAVASSENLGEIVFDKNNTLRETLKASSATFYVGERKLEKANPAKLLIKTDNKDLILDKVYRTRIFYQEISKADSLKFEKHRCSSTIFRAFNPAVWLTERELRHWLKIVVKAIEDQGWKRKARNYRDHDFTAEEVPFYRDNSPILFVWETPSYVLYLKAERFKPVTTAPTLTEDIFSTTLSINVKRD